MAIRTIELLEAPAAQPRSVSKVVPQGSWLEIIDAPQYELPKSNFTSEGTKIEPGVAEISSPLLVTNITSDQVSVTAEILRENGDVSTIAYQFPVPVADALPLPLQGQFLLAGDIVRVQADKADALQATVSWTEGQAEQGVKNVN